MSTLTIPFTDNTVANKDSIILNQNSVDVSTSLALYGQGSMNYGAALWSNMIKIMEHFCSRFEPNNPTEGQLWYDPYDRCLKVYSTNKDQVYGWYKLYIDNPDSNGPAITIDALTAKVLEGFVKQSGDVMSGTLTLPKEELDPTTGKLYLSTELSEKYAATRYYVDKKSQERIDSLVKVTESDKKQNPYYITVGNIFTLSGVAYNDGSSMFTTTDLTSTSTVNGNFISYGKKFHFTLFLPNELQVAMDSAAIIDPYPLFDIQAHAELGHDNTDIDNYIKTTFPHYPVKAIEVKKTYIVFECVCGALIDSAYADYYSQSRLRSYYKTDIPDINSKIICRSIKYTITGRLLNV